VKKVIAAMTIFLSVPALARDDDAVSIGNGVYMLTDRNITIFGSADGIIAKLMRRANTFCQSTAGTGAELVDSSGSDAVPGSLNNSGTLRRAAQGASGTIYFRCGPAPAPTPPPAQTAQADSYYERVNSLRRQVLSGEIPAGRGLISPQVSSAFTRLQSADAEMIEGRSTWWIDSGTWFIHIKNVTEADLEAFEFAVNFGSCATPTSPVERALIQLQRPIPAGEQAVINFPRPIATDKVEPNMCGVVTAVWGSGG
jgi:hypothetical protein